MVGISAAANVVAALRVARTLRQGVVVTILCDSAAKYLSEPFWNETGGSCVGRRRDLIADLDFGFCLLLLCNRKVYILKVCRCSAIGNRKSAIVMIKLTPETRAAIAAHAASYLSR